jgi:hypothetical protein
MATKTYFTSDAEMASKELFADTINDDARIGDTGNVPIVTGLKYWLKRLAVETGGIERITDVDRAENPSKVWNACTFW